MLPRTLEPEVMDSREDAWDYDSMDHGQVNRRFVEDLLAAGLVESEKPKAVSGKPDNGSAQPKLAGQPTDDVERPPLLLLDIGTGTAQIPILLCQQIDDVRVMAADAAVSMLDLARLNVEIAGLRDRIQLDQADAKQMAYRDCMFDAVISNSIIHHIPAPRDVLAEAIRVTKLGGLLFFRDLKRPDDEAEVERLVETYAAGCNDHQRKLYRDSLHAALRVEEMRALIAGLGFAAETVQATSDRHWTWTVRRSHSS
jgi:ubiquinone/menaquinone biosynthesis C-methylase UbiE